MSIEEIDLDEFGHQWDMGWEDSEKPHPGFGGTQDIYGGYVSICAKCGLKGYNFKNQVCGEGNEKG
jgi:hypothetical protein